MYIGVGNRFRAVEKGKTFMSVVYFVFFSE
jgi:hypothetical protein